MLRGDVETIVAKSLSKERERRYQSAGELASDILRFLNGEPIDAKKDSFWYVLHKTARRNMIQTTVAASVLIIFGSAVSLVGHYMYVASTAEVEKAGAEQAAATELRYSTAMTAESRRVNFAWYVNERNAGRLDATRALMVFASNCDPNAPETTAMRFLAEELSFEQLSKRVGKQNQALAYFALGEHEFRAHSPEAAQIAYRQALATQPGPPPRLKLLLEARLAQLEAKERVTSTPPAEGDLPDGR